MLCFLFLTETRPTDKIKSSFTFTVQPVCLEQRHTAAKYRSSYSASVNKIMIRIRLCENSLNMDKSEACSSSKHNKELVYNHTKINALLRKKYLFCTLNQGTGETFFSQNAQKSDFWCVSVIFLYK